MRLARCRSENRCADRFQERVQLPEFLVLTVLVVLAAICLHLLPFVVIVGLVSGHLSGRIKSWNWRHSLLFLLSLLLIALLAVVHRVSEPW